MNNSNNKSIVLTFLLCSFISSIYSQTSSISGKVGKGSVPKGCKIVLKNSAGVEVVSKELITSDYIIENVPNGVYTISVVNDEADDYLNGVSILDMVLCQRHILGLQVQTAPEVLIAADTNNDGKITASDLTETRKLILGLINKFPNSTAWMFPIRSSLSDTFPFWNLEYEQFIDLQSNITGIDFDVIKIGDLNGNAN